VHSDLEEVLIDEAQIKERISELGAEIARDYRDKNLLMIGILKGALPFLADLMRSVDLPVSYDLMAVSSYGASTKTSGTVRINKDLDIDIEDKDVIIVEDIVDTGLTLTYLLENLRSRKVKSIKICTLLDKPSRRKVQIKPDYNGFEIDDIFVVGFGLDYAEKYRNLPYIGVLKPEVYSK
jgi:hypoxanthine phosphoribosyltransferase